MIDETLNPLNNDGTVVLGSAGSILSKPISSTLVVTQLPAQPATPQSDTGLDNRVYVLEQKLEAIIPIVENLVTAVTAILNDIRTFNIFGLFKDSTGILSELAELNAIVKGR